MERNIKENGFLDLLIRPGFCVKDDQITAVNQAAQCLLITPGTSISELLLNGCEEYAAFQDGCLYLTVNLAGGSRGASVIRMDGLDYFILDQDSDDDALKALSLAARVLREPLTSMMVSAQQLTAADDCCAEQLARLNRGMHQMLRLIGNMSDADGGIGPHMEIRDIPVVFSGIFENAQTLVSQTGRSLHYESNLTSLLGLMDEGLLERAILNILSNSIKFSSAGSEIRAQLTRHGQMLTLSIQDSGSGIARNLQHTLFQRYLRQPGIEDGRFGLGLGMVLIRNAAAAHGGTVLIDQPNGVGTRISLTLAIRQTTADALRSPVLRVDYSGEQDHGLVELSDCLPLSLYTKE